MICSYLGDDTLLWWLGVQGTWLSSSSRQKQQPGTNIYSSRSQETRVLIYVLIGHTSTTQSTEFSTFMLWNYKAATLSPHLEDGDSQVLQNISPSQRSVITQEQKQEAVVFHHC
jgi:hypothetical protein